MRILRSAWCLCRVRTGAFTQAGQVQLAASNTLANSWEMSRSVQTPVPCVELRVALGEGVSPSVSWGLAVLAFIARYVRPPLLLLLGSVYTGPTNLLDHD